jgi:colanic acid/amylovoran biosynthesis protein
MKILITNVHSTHNAGDRVLLDVVLQQLYAQFPAAEITIAMNDPAGYPANAREQVVGSFTHWLKSSKRGDAAWRMGALLMAPWLLLQSLMVAAGVRWFARPVGLPRSAALRALLQSYLDADMVVSCAGNFLYSSGMTGIPFLLAAYAISYGWLLGKPVYMMPQTIGPLRRRWERLALRRFLRPVRLIFVRDGLSRDLLAEIGLHPPQVRLAPDMAFLYMPTADVDVSPLLLPLIRHDSSATRPLLGVTLINWGAQNRAFNGQRRYEAAVATAIRAFVTETGGSAILFSQVTGPTAADDDRIPAQRVADLLHDLGGRVIAVEEQLSPGQLKSGYGQMDIFLGSRLHSNIFALTAGSPVMAIAYQYKTHGVMRMLGLEAWVLDIERVDGENLSEEVRRLWRQRARVRAQIAARLPALQQEIRQATGWIEADFARLNRKS